VSLLTLHKKLERNSGLLIFGILFVSSIGGLVQIIPSIFQESLSTPAANLAPYTPLQLLGRDVYIREGCATCHSQQIRSLLAEVKRYGPYSRADEFVYDRPFLWGSKRTGPDLHRVGGKYSDAWHRVHLLDPRAVVPVSIMPAYPWLAERAANDDGSLEPRLRALQRLGHPYSDDDIAAAAATVEGMTDLDALIAYLQSLGLTRTRVDGL
jgi:cytochrome c oxidase cbb3-type subunit II